MSKMYSYYYKIYGRSKEGEIVESINHGTKAVRFRTAAYRAVDHVTRWGRLDDKIESISLSITREEV